VCEFISIEQGMWMPAPAGQLIKTRSLGARCRRVNLLRSEGFVKVNVITCSKIIIDKLIAAYLARMKFLSPQEMTAKPCCE